jgi:nitroimidazol reductase NimA-like FMN-containing flavoprotein (pyridoxamine 5'-phosphate oxidase superfamily)
MASKGRQVLTSSVRRFLATPRIARLCTKGRDGYPHVVPIYYMRQGDDIVFGSDRDETKVRNALRNPKAAVVIGGEPDRDSAGYMIQGDLTVEANPDRALIRRLLLRYEPPEEAERFLAGWSPGGGVLIRMKSRKVIRVW